jgi:hypothetical protein
MKKYICMFLISWLPIFMASANAMSMQMAFTNQHANAHDMTQVSCHEDAQKMHQHAAEHHQPHNCTLCGFCIAVGSAAIFNPMPLIHVHALVDTKPVFIDVRFNSLQTPPAFKPPISV